MKSLVDFQTDHLFLLVGKNPLPNYVAAKLLATPTGKIYFVHSSETVGLVQNLIRVLEIPPARQQLIEVGDADAHSILTRLTEQARNKNSVGLHYTGGTKAMAVHAYRAIREAAHEAIFSYLNAETLQIYIDQPGKLSKRYPVGLEVTLSIEELLNLHGYQLEAKTVTTNPFQPNFCRDMLKVPHSTLRQWCNAHLRTDKGIKNKRELERNPVLLPTGEAFNPLKAHWTGCRTLDDLADQWGLKVRQAAKFLDGKWLEHYTLEALKQVKSESHITDYGLGIKPKRPRRSFEFDIVAMRGYQLFALSCSTTKPSKRNIKQKLFEAYIRARQMGGDEARVAVVGFTPHQLDNNPEKVEHEIAEMWAETNQKVRVFGETHLPNLPKHLKAWFNQ